MPDKKAFRLSVDENADYDTRDLILTAKEDTDILIDYSAFKKIDIQSEGKVLVWYSASDYDINIKALTRLTKYFLPKIIKYKNGGILNVASTKISVISWS